MGNKKVENIIHSLLLALLTASMIGGFIFYTEYKVDRANQINSNKTITNKITQVKADITTKNQGLNVRIDGLVNKNAKFTHQIDTLNINLNQLSWSVCQNNKAMKKSLEEIKKFNIIANN